MPKVDAMRTIQMVVTPAIAEEWLSPLNITPHAPYVKQLAQRIQLDEWITGTASDAITFDRNGNLIDGLYRLNAIVEADTPVLIHVTMPINMLLPQTWSIVPMPPESLNDNDGA